MNSEDWNILLLLIACCICLWLTILFVRLCIHVKAIKAILLVAYDLEETEHFVGEKFVKTIQKKATRPDQKS